MLKNFPPLKKYVVVPVDGASNIKLEVFDLETLECVFNVIANSPTAHIDGLCCNATLEEFNWFEEKIAALPQEIKSNIAIISPVARGASAGLIDKDNNIIDVKTKAHTLAYNYSSPEVVEENFAKLAGSPEQFYQETGSILYLPGSLTLVKRLLFEAMIRPDIWEKSVGFATYNILMSGYFLGNQYLNLIKRCGNEHTYWMCHTGARNIHKKPGTFSSIVEKIPKLRQLIPLKPANCYHVVGNIAANKARLLGLSKNIQLTPGGHDTALSHVPLINLIKKYYFDKLIHVDLGTWTMCSSIGDKSKLPVNGYKFGIIAQGTVDGQAVVTSAYGGGNDFKYIKSLTQKAGLSFYQDFNLEILNEVLTAKDSFILPNINPLNKGTGPFPNLVGKIINEDNFFSRSFAGKQHIIINLTIAYVIYYQLTIINKDLTLPPIILTAGGSSDPYLGKLLMALTNSKVYQLCDSNNQAISETTSLGAAIIGKTAYLQSENNSFKIKPHPYNIELFNMSLLPFDPLPEQIAAKVKGYCKCLANLCS